MNHSINELKIEKHFSQLLQASEGGQLEYPCEVGFVDLPTKFEVIEVKCLNGWKGGLGQASAYASCFPDKSNPENIIDFSEVKDLQLVETATNKFFDNYEELDDYFKLLDKMIRVTKRICLSNALA